MSGFLDRLAARAVGEAPALLRPRVRARFEPGAGVLPAEPAAATMATATATAGEGGSQADAPARLETQVEIRSPVAARTFEPVPRSLPAETSAPALPFRPPSRPADEEGPRPATALPPAARVASGEMAPAGEVGRPRRDPPPGDLPAAASRRPAGPGEQQGTPMAPVPVPLRTRAAAPRAENSSTSSASGQEEGGRRAHGEERSVGELAARPLASPERLRPAPLSSETAAAAAAEPPAPRPLRPARAAALPTVEPDRRAPLPPSLDSPAEPSETVVRVSIGRIDVRAAPAPAVERRPAQPAGPRLSLTDYLKRREEGRR